ncbi:hypothetical protein L9G16_02075 [Shewanella sp. A25]|nr:hypothetical protein [Shewanella shenzhenensis]
MMKRFNFNSASKAMLGAGLLSLLLVGCGGSDGKDGEDGKPGEVAVDINSATSVKTQVELASYDEASNTLTVEFSFTNANGVAITGLETIDNSIRLAFGRMGSRSEAFTPFTVGEGETLANVTARADGDEQIWLSYRNKDKGNGAIAGSAYWSSTGSCPEGSTCLTYLGQGKYQVKAPDVINTLGMDYSYDAAKIQGVYLITYGVGTNKLKNVETYYWDPQTEKSVTSPKKQIAMETCTNCHVGQEHIHHGNFGNNADQCSFCHTDYTTYSKTDADGNSFSIDGSIKGLVHGIHTGITETDRRGLAKFSTVIADTTKNPAFKYFDGFVKDDDGNARLNFPASTANCQQCHVSFETTEETLPEDLSTHALAWFADKNVTSCQSCHGDYHHGNEVAPTTNADGTTATELVGCVNCHNSNDGNTRGGAFRHFAGTDVNNGFSRSAASQAGLLVTTSYSNINWDSTNSVLTFKVNLTKDGQAVTTEYINGTPTIYVNAVNSSTPDAFLASRPTSTVTANADGGFDVSITATSTSSTLPALADALNNGATLAITSSFSTCFSNKTSTLLAYADGACTGVVSPNAAKTEFIKLDGSVGVARVSAVNYDNCTACHNNDMVARSSGYHYRNADVNTCAMCHEAGDYNSLIVRVHGTFGKAHGREDVKALISSAECSACHNNTDYALDHARSTPMRWNRKDATFSSPQAGVCASCHVSDYYTIGSGKESAKAHIESMGGVIAGTYSEASISGESCQTCHDASFIKSKHGFN